MVEVGIRQLKSQLSYYVQLMQTGETVAIKVHNRVVGFLSKLRPASQKESLSKKRSALDVERLIEKLQKKGLLLSGGPYRHHSFKPVTLKGSMTASEMIRQMRDEEL